MSGDSVGHAAVSSPLVHPGSGDGEGSAASHLLPTPPANAAGGRRPNPRPRPRAKTLSCTHNPRGHSAREAGPVQETQRHIIERCFQHVSDLSQRLESRNRWHQRAAVHTHLPQRVYRGVVVEETVLSHVSRSGVHTPARLLDLHQGQSPLKPPGRESDIIRLP